MEKGDETFSDIFRQGGYYHEAGCFCDGPSSVVLLNFKAKSRRHLVDSSPNLVWFISLGYEDVLNDIESTKESENCDSRPVRRTPEVVEV